MTKDGPTLTLKSKNLVAQFLLANSTNGVVHNGKASEAAARFGVSRRTIHYIWKAAKKQVSECMPIHIISQKKNIVREKAIHLDMEAMKNIPFSKRSTIRTLAKGLGVSKTQTGRWVKNKVIKAHTNAIHPQLTDDNKVHRLQFSLQSVIIDSISNKITFTDMYNVVHIDEKWFYMSRACERYYLAEGEEGPHRSCKSKRYIPKIMFMAAVARPQNACDGQEAFDGKIGIFPLITKEPAQRNSKNRVRGTMVTKPIESITKEVTKACIINEVIPAIKAKWPANASKNIFIQQDNAKPHISNDDPDFRAAASSDGFNIVLVCQPSNSPDTNILDLGWFRAIQSLQVETTSKDCDDIVKNVLLSFAELPSMSLNKVFLTLQSCLIEIMKVKGGNNYKIPHMSKERLIREERLPISLEVTEDLVRECMQYLMDMGQLGDLGNLEMALGI